MTFCSELEIQTIGVFLDFYRLPNQLARGGCALGSDVPTGLIDRPDLGDSGVLTQTL